MASKSKKSNKADTKTSSIEESVPDQVDRNQMISEAAYYIAEKRGFTPAKDTDDWLEAEKQIDELLAEKGGNTAFNIEREFSELTDALKRQRGEIQLQIHLASMDAKDEWKNAEKAWSKFVDDLDLISDDTKETGVELIHATKVIGDELKEIYLGISERLGK